MLATWFVLVDRLSNFVKLELWFGGKVTSIGSIQLVGRSFIIERA